MNFTKAIKQLKEVVKGNHEIFKHDKKRIVFANSYQVKAVSENYSFAINFDTGLETGFYYLSSLTLKSKPIEINHDSKYLYVYLDSLDVSKTYEPYTCTDSWASLKVVNEVAGVELEEEPWTTCNRFIQVNLQDTSCQLFGINPFTLYGSESPLEFKDTVRLPSTKLAIPKDYSRLAVHAFDDFIRFRSFEYELCITRRDSLRTIEHHSLCSFLPDYDRRSKTKYFKTKIRLGFCRNIGTENKYVAITKQGIVGLSEDFDFTGFKLYHFDAKQMDCEQVYIFAVDKLYPYRHNLNYCLHLHPSNSNQQYLVDGYHHGDATGAKTVAAIMPIRMVRDREHYTKVLSALYQAFETSYNPASLCG